MGRRARARAQSRNAGLGKPQKSCGVRSSASDSASAAHAAASVVPWQAGTLPPGGAQAASIVAKVFDSTFATHPSVAGSATDGPSQSATSILPLAALATQRERHLLFERRPFTRLLETPSSHFASCVVGTAPLASRQKTAG